MTDYKSMPIGIIQNRKIRLPRFNDMHTHFRDIDIMPRFANYHARYAKHVVAMPNLSDPLINGPMCVDYRSAIKAAAPGLEPIVPLYLTNNTTPAIISYAYQFGVKSAKWYPAGVTTGSHHGVVGVLDDDVLSQMEDCGMILSVHAEQPGESVLYAENHFIAGTLESIFLSHPNLKVIIEHISTAMAVSVVKSYDNVAATITPHHMMYNIDDLLGANGLQPRLYCKPLLKTEANREAVMEAAFSGSSKFFLGSDSAPHASSMKYKDCGCAGVFTAPNLPEMLIRFFDKHSQLDKLADFTSNFGADFYDVPRCGTVDPATSTEETVIFNLDRSPVEDSLYTTLVE